MILENNGSNLSGGQTRLAIRLFKSGYLMMKRQITLIYTKALESTISE